VYRTCSGIVKTAQKKAESAKSNSSSSALKSEGRKFDRFALFTMVCNLLASSALISSSSALKSEGRKFDRFALFTMVCNLLASSALINPRQEGFAYAICARRVARATSHSAGPLRPWLFKRFQSIESRGCFGSYKIYMRSAG